MKKSSWHYKLASFVDTDVGRWRDITICEYVRKVIYGAAAMLTVGLIMLAVVFGLGVIVFMLCQTIGATLGYLQWTDELIGFGVAFSAFCATFLAIYMYVRVKQLAKVASEHLAKEDNQSFSASVYKRYKQKVCFTVKFD